MDIYTATEEAYKNGYADGFAEGQKIKRGKWIKKSASAWVSISCSECGCYALGYLNVDSKNNPKYCSNCGARMDSGSDSAERERKTI